jgi:hypothetical protein
MAMKSTPDFEALRSIALRTAEIPRSSTTSARLGHNDRSKGEAVGGGHLRGHPEALAAIRVVVGDEHANLLDADLAFYAFETGPQQLGPLMGGDAYQDVYFDSPRRMSALIASDREGMRSR